jgi:Arc/MetJ-type ribon-helix-helix transcriptional regulator
MATDTASFPSEIEALTAPLVASGKFANTSEVVRAAIEALHKQLDEQAYDEACVRAAEEGEASGLYDGDPFERIRAKYGWKTRFAE